MKKNIQINIPNVTLIFPNLFEKTPIDGKFTKSEEDRKFSATFLLNKDEHAFTIDQINTAIEELKKDLKVKSLRHPVMVCCDEELDAIFTGDEAGKDKKAKMSYKANHFQLVAKSKIQPQLRKIKGVENNLDIEKDENPFYPGCKVHAVIELAPYDNDFGKGISKYLKLVLFAQHGERLGNSTANLIDDSCFEDPPFEIDVKEEDLF